jgi:hypothetical protein
MDPKEREKQTGEDEHKPTIKSGQVHLTAFWRQVAEQSVTNWCWKYQSTRYFDCQSTQDS